MPTHLAAAPTFSRDETLEVAALLALAGGYLDAYSWIVHRAFANAQIANLVFLWVYATSADWQKALHYLPPLAAFVLGIVMGPICACSPRSRAGQISILVEIAFLFIVAILHNRLPNLAGTLGISFVAAMQTSSFPKVEEWNCSSVMATSNFRHSIEGLFAAIATSSAAHRFRRPYVFGAVCVAFGAGATLGAFVTERCLTKQAPGFSLAIPVALLLIVLLRCECGDTSVAQPTERA